MAKGASDPKVRSISNIKSLLMQPALTSHYEVFIQPPKSADDFILKSGFSERMSELLLLSCSDASLPGSTLATHELNNDFTGVTQRHAYRRLYDDRADFSFYVNHTYDQIRYFEAWIRYMIGEEISGSEKLEKSYRVKYPNQYKSTLYITKFERNIGKVGKDGKTVSNKGSKKMVYSFFNAFPTSVGSMQISYETSQLLKVTVSFTYDRYVASNDSYVGQYSEPGQSTANGVPNSPFDLTPSQQANINSAYSQNLNLGNYSSGTFTNSNFDRSSVQFDDSQAFSGNFNLF